MTTRFVYRKSSASNPKDDCVEIASNVPGVRAIRDSKDPRGPHLEFPTSSFATFLIAIKSGHTAQR